VLGGDELAALLERVPDIVWRYRFVPAPGFEYVSPSAFALTGFTPQEHYADPDLGRRIVHPDDAALLEEVIQSPAEHSRVHLRWRHRDGGEFTTEQRITVVRDEGGEIVALEGIGRPLTGKEAPPFQLRAGEVVLDLAAHRALVGDRVVELTPAEHRILALLAASDGPVEQGALVAGIWGTDTADGQRALQVHVSNLRRKLEEDPARPQRLVTYRGVGYGLAR
jgi:Transcriptional regulatory protein, C terminal/PAS fold